MYKFIGISMYISGIFSLFLTVVLLSVTILNLISDPNTSLLMYLFNSSPEIIAYNGEETFAAIVLTVVWYINIFILSVIFLMYLYHQCPMFHINRLRNTDISLIKNDCVTILEDISHLSLSDCYDVVKAITDELLEKYEQNGKLAVTKVKIYRELCNKVFIVGLWIPVTVLSIYLIISTIYLEMWLQHNNILLKKYDKESMGVLDSQHKLSNIFTIIANNSNNREIVYLIEKDKFIHKFDYDHGYNSIEGYDKVKDIKVNMSDEYIRNEINHAIHHGCNESIYLESGRCERPACMRRGR